MEAGLVVVVPRTARPRVASTGRTRLDLEALRAPVSDSELLERSADETENLIGQDEMPSPPSTGAPLPERAEQTPRVADRELDPADEGAELAPRARRGRVRRAGGLEVGRTELDAPGPTTERTTDVVREALEEELRRRSESDREPLDETRQRRGGRILSATRCRANLERDTVASSVDQGNGSFSVQPRGRTERLGDGGLRAARVSGYPDRAGDDASLLRLESADKGYDARRRVERSAGPGRPATSPSVSRASKRSPARDDHGASDLEARG